MTLKNNLKLLKFQREHLAQLVEFLKDSLVKFPCFSPSDSFILLKKIEVFLQSYAEIQRWTAANLELCLIKNAQALSSLERIISDTIKMAEVSFAASKEQAVDFLRELHAIKENFTTMHAQAATIQEKIRDFGAAPTDIATAYAANLKKIKEKFSYWYDDLYKVLLASKSTKNIKELKKNKKFYQQALEELKQLQVVAELFGNDFYKDILAQHPKTLLSFGADLLDKDVIVAVLRRMRNFYEHYYLWTSEQMEQFVKRFLDADMEELIKKSQKYIFLQKWFQRLVMSKREIDAKYTSESFKNRLAKALKVKQLLINYKSQCRRVCAAFKYSRFEAIRQLYNQIKQVQRGGIKTAKSYLTATEFIAYFDSVIEELQVNIKAGESSLKNYGWIVGCAAAIARLGTDYYAVIPAYYAAVEQEIELSPVLKGAPILGVSLESGYKEFGPKLVGAGCLGFDLASLLGSRYFGIPHSLLQIFVKNIAADLDTIIALGKKIDISEDYIMQHETELQWFLGLCLDVSLNSCMYGASLGSLALFSLGYSMATACRSLAGYLSKYIVREASPLSQFCKAVLQYFGYGAGHWLGRKTFAAMAPFFQERPAATKPSAHYLLQDRDTCLAYRKECWEVLNTFGLEKNATKKKVRQQKRQSILDTHPDRTHEDTGGSFSEVMLAYDRALDLLTKP